MDAAARAEIEAIFAEAVTVLADRAAELLEPEWQRRGDTWSSSRAYRGAPSPELPRLGARFDAALRAAHPDHCGLVGLAGVTALATQGERVVTLAALDALGRAGSADRAHSLLADIVSQLERVIESPTINVQIVAPLSHFSMELESLPLGDFVIRRLEDDEATRLFGNRPDLFGTYVFGPPHFAIVGSIPFPKALGGTFAQDASLVSKVRADIHAILVALRVFQSGPVGCREILLEPASGPLGLGRVAFGFDPDIPLGDYKLFPGQANQVVDTWTQIRLAHEALQFAGDRLSDAALRRDSRDRLVDCVTGLEAILLHGINEGEFSYRFGLRYAALHPGGGEQRFQAFKDARLVYKRRSEIVHGVGKGTVTIATVAEEADKMLRSVLRRFLPEGRSPAFLEDGFWERTLLRSDLTT